MPKYDDPVGKGGLWLAESKSGNKYMFGEITFQYNGHSVTCKLAVFKNTRKEGKQPDYNIFVNDSFPAKAKEIKKPEPTSQAKIEEDIPF